MLKFVHGALFTDSIIQYPATGVESVSLDADQVNVNVPSSSSPGVIVGTPGVVGAASGTTMGLSPLMTAQELHKGVLAVSNAQTQ